MYNSSGMVWWQGVVQDVNDPEQIGRVRVRIFGYHISDIQKLPIENLPWASPIMPISSASIGGLGQSPTGVVVGSWVVGFFRDGENAQDPIIFGTIPGLPQESADKSNSFSDPEGKYPGQFIPHGSDLRESDVNRLARGVTSDTIVETKKSSVDGTIGEPVTPYGAQYPDNNVISTKSGHHIEFDDTPGVERIHIYHKSGTFIEIHPDGTTVKKTQSDDYEIINGDKSVHITGNLNMVVDGKIEVSGGSSAEYKYAGKHDLTSGGNTTVKAPKIDLNP